MKINKLVLDNKSYDISLNGNSSIHFVSDDNNISNSFTEVSILSNTDTTGTIFQKISSMIKNVRYLYKCMGTSFSPTNTISNKLENHTHTVSQLPISSTQINSSSFIPDSQLIYNMNEYMINILKLKRYTVTLTTETQLVLPIQQYPTILSVICYSDNQNLLCMIRKTVTNWEIDSYKTVKQNKRNVLTPYAGATFEILYME